MQQNATNNEKHFMKKRMCWRDKNTIFIMHERQRTPAEIFEPKKDYPKKEKGKRKGINKSVD